MQPGYFVWTRSSEQVVPPPGKNERQDRIDQLGKALVMCREIRLIIEPDPHISSKESRCIDDTCDELYSRLLDEIRRGDER